MSDTPEADKAWEDHFRGVFDTEYTRAETMLQLARRLERERDEARKERDRYKKAIKHVLKDSTFATVPIWVQEILRKAMDQLAKNVRKTKIKNVDRPRW